MACAADEASAAVRERRVGVGILLGAIACASFTTLTGVAQLPPDLDQRIALFTRYLDPLRIQAGVPGLSVGVISAGQLVWERGYGFADIEARVPAAPDTPYRIASLTKTFTSALLMRCVDARTLNLDTPIRNYTTTVPDPAASVRHVLSMTSDAPPGSRYRYDGDRFGALTPVVQACTGAPYRVALASQILDRLAMLDSVPGQDLEAPSSDVAALFDTPTLDRYRRVVGRLAKPYVWRNGRASLGEYPPRGINAAAGLISTVRDLARYDAANDARILVSAESQSVAWTPFTLADGRASPYGVGWFSQATVAGRAVWHYGLWPTFSSLLLRLPERGVTLVMLANSDGLSARFPLAEGDVTVSPFARAFIAAVK
jgi:CubicO group peptidase (beta-lactamase class C family)